MLNFSNTFNGCQWLERVKPAFPEIFAWTHYCHHTEVGQRVGNSRQSRDVRFQMWSLDDGLQMRSLDDGFQMRSLDEGSRCGP